LEKNKISFEDFPFNGKGIDAIKFRFFYNKTTKKIGCEGLVYYKRKRPHNFYECGLNNKFLKLVKRSRIRDSVLNNSNHFKGYEILNLFNDEVAGEIREGNIFITWKKTLTTSKKFNLNSLYDEEYECTLYKEGSEV
jgi:hypothetical protein